MTVQNASRPPHIAGRRGRLVGLFVVYLLLLAWLILWKFEVPWVGGGALRQIKLMPFASSADADANTLREVIANVAFFIPFGLYLGSLAPSWRWWGYAGTIAAVSLALEVAQYTLAIGSSDVTDLVGNTVGGMAGSV